MKPIRKAVRTYLIEDNKVVVIKYTTENNFGYYDIPGGKIEDGEKPYQTAIREFKEETGIDIINPILVGNLLIEYPERVFDFDVFLAKEYNGRPKTTEENEAMWIEIDDLLKQDKIFSTVYMLDEEHLKKILNKDNFKFHFISDSYHRKINEL